jgi:M6 family metalloprotease-like protein
MLSFPTSNPSEPAKFSPSVSRVGLDGPSTPERFFSPMEVSGTFSLIVILVKFTDQDNYFTESEVANTAIVQLNNYYEETSYNMVHITGDTTNWIDLGHDRDYYVDGTSFPSDPKFQLVLDSINAADSVVNFSAYSGVTIIHAGEGQELSHDWRDYWSSEWWGFSINTDDGATITRASVSPEQSTPNEPAYVGVIAHEFGHDLGLPDLYDITYSGYEYVGSWGLMGKGSWNGPLGVGDLPSHQMGWSKAFLGWVNGSQLVTAPAAFSVTIDPLELPTTGVHLVKVPVDADHYFLIEVRKKIGYDTGLPSQGPGGEGVLVTYIDETKASGHGIVQVIDAHPETGTVDDGAFGIGIGQVDTFVSAPGQFTMIVEDALGDSYNITLLRAYMSFITPVDGSGILTSNFTAEWSGFAAAPGIDHYELYIDDIQVYSGLGTSHPLSSLTAGSHNATLVMELVGSGRRLAIQSHFIIDLADPIIHMISHIPATPGFGDQISITAEITDDTWINNATIIYRRGSDPVWYEVEMTQYSGSEWRGNLGTFLPGISVTYYVRVTDAGGRSVSDDNSGSYYTLTVSGFGLIIWLILIGAVILIVLIIICLAIQRRRQRPTRVTVMPVAEPVPKPPDYSSPPPTVSRKSSFCFHCGAPLTPGSRYCGHCGRTIDKEY